MTPHKPFVSVVVPVYNESRTLADCLAALRSQDYDGAYEVIVVDNGSSDGSADIARAMGMRIVHEPRKGVGRAARAGFAAARGEIIARTDADTRVPPNWLSRLVRGLTERPGVVALGGTCLFDDGPLYLQGLGRVMARAAAGLSGANLAVWRWAYEEAGGFDPNLSCSEDADLGLRLERLGRVVIDRRLPVYTSSRRHQWGMLPAIWRYSANYASLRLFHRVLYNTLSDVRREPPRAYVRRRLFPVVVLLALALALPIFAAVSPRAQAFGPVLSQAVTREKVVALTFDDMPDVHTQHILETLEAYGVPATFFLVGEKVEQYPALARRIVADGHAVGNQTYGFPLLAAVQSREEMQRELDQASAAIGRITGVDPSLFRPPYGWRSPALMSVAENLGYVVVTWSVSPEWWSQSPEGLAESILSQVEPGSIIRFHQRVEEDDEGAAVPEVSAALPEIIGALRAQGYRFVSVPELLELDDLPGVQTAP